MATRRRGSIVVIGSPAAREAYASQVHYSAAKAGLQMLALGMAWELGPLGIRTNIVHPGWIETELNREYLWENPTALDGILEQIPLGRTGLAGRRRRRGGLAVHGAGRLRQRRLAHRRRRARRRPGQDLTASHSTQRGIHATTRHGAGAPTRLRRALLLSASAATVAVTTGTASATTEPPPVRFRADQRTGDRLGRAGRGQPLLGRSARRRRRGGRPARLRLPRRERRPRPGGAGLGRAADRRPGPRRDHGQRHRSLGDRRGVPVRRRRTACRSSTSTGSTRTPPRASRSTRSAPAR